MKEKINPARKALENLNNLLSNQPNSEQTVKEFTSVATQVNRIVDHCIDLYNQNQGIDFSDSELLVELIVDFLELADKRTNFGTDPNLLIKQQNSDDYHNLFLLGKTGKGKSTIANYLSGKKLVIRENEDEKKILDSEGVSDAVVSCTSDISIHSNNLQKINYIDTPGIGDNRGFIIEGVNSHLIHNKIMSGAKNSLVLVYEWDDIKPKTRIPNFIKFVEGLKEIFGSPENFLKLKDTLAIVVTKVKQKKDLEKVFANYPAKLKKINVEELQDYQVISDFADILASKEIKILKFPKPKGDLGKEFTIPDNCLNALNNNVLSNLGTFNVKHEDEKDLFSFTNLLSQNAKNTSSNLAKIINDYSKLLMDSLKSKLEQRIYEKINKIFIAEDIREFFKGFIDILSQKIRTDKDFINLVTKLTKKIPGFENDFDDFIEKTQNISKVFSYLQSCSINASANYTEWLEKLTDFGNKVCAEWSKPPKMKQIEETKTIELASLVSGAIDINIHFKNNPTYKYIISKSFIFTLSEDILAPEKSLSIVSPIWNISGQKVIDLSGKSYDQIDLGKAHSGVDYTNPHGKIGGNGKNGGNGGNFYQHILEMNYLGDEQSKIIVRSNGGNGQHGQNGGDGANGKNGKLDVGRLLSNIEQAENFKKMFKKYHAIAKKIKESLKKCKNDEIFSETITDFDKEYAKLDAKRDNLEDNSKKSKLSTLMYSNRKEKEVIVNIYKFEQDRKAIKSNIKYFQETDVIDTKKLVAVIDDEEIFLSCTEYFIIKHANHEKALEEFEEAIKNTSKDKEVIEKNLENYISLSKQLSEQEEEVEECVNKFNIDLEQLKNYLPNCDEFKNSDEFNKYINHIDDLDNHRVDYFKSKIELDNIAGHSPIFDPNFDISEMQQFPDINDSEGEVILVPTGKLSVLLPNYNNDLNNSKVLCCKVKKEMTSLSKKIEDDLKKIEIFDLAYQKFHNASKNFVTLTLSESEMQKQNLENEKQIIEAKEKVIETKKIMETARNDMISVLNFGERFKSSVFYSKKNDFADKAYAYIQDLKSNLEVLKQQLFNLQIHYNELSKFNKNFETAIDKFKNSEKCFNSSKKIAKVDYKNIQKQINNLNSDNADESDVSIASNPYKIILEKIQLLHEQMYSIQSLQDGKNDGEGIRDKLIQIGKVTDIILHQESNLVERTREGFKDRTTGKKILEGLKSLLLFNTRYIEKYEFTGTNAEVGGNAGKGGQGGVSGKFGNIYLNQPSLFKIESIIGRNGNNGIDGKPGKGGKHPDFLKGTYIDEYCMPILRKLVPSINDIDNKKNPLRKYVKEHDNSDAQQKSRSEPIMRKNQDVEIDFLEDQLLDYVSAPSRAGVSAGIAGPVLSFLLNSVDDIAILGTRLTVTTGASVAGAALTLGLTLVVQTVLSIASSYISKGWRSGPFIIKGKCAQDGKVDDNDKAVNVEKDNDVPIEINVRQVDRKLQEYLGSKISAFLNFTPVINVYQEVQNHNQPILLDDLILGEDALNQDDLFLNN